MKSADDIVYQLDRLLHDSAVLEQTRQTAYRVITSHLGATEKTVNHILKQSETQNNELPSHA